MAPRHPGPLQKLDVEVLRFLVRAGMARPDALVAWTGASPWTIRASYRRLTGRELVRARPVTMQLRDANGTVRESAATVWAATKAGSTLLRAMPHFVPGTTVRTSLGAPKTSPHMADHTVGAAHLAAWYRGAGVGEVAFERDIVRLERPSAIAGQPRQTVVAWTVTVPGMRGVHPPDLGVVHDGQLFAVELERKEGERDNYVALLAAYRDVGIGLIWHVATKLSWTRLHEAASYIGTRWGASPGRGVNMSADGMLRIQGWAPGRVLAGPASWATAGNIPAAPPAGFPSPGVPVKLDNWRLGTVVDPHAPQQNLWEPADVLDAA